MKTAFLFGRFLFDGQIGTTTTIVSVRVFNLTQPHKLLFVGMRNEANLFAKKVESF